MRARARERDDEYSAYVGERLDWLHKIAFLLCQDASRADDLVQTACTRLYVHWNRARAADNLDAYTRTILVRVFLSEQQGGWRRRVSLRPEVPDAVTGVADLDLSMDLRSALDGLTPGQRAAIVLRYYCDLSVEQTAQALECSTGNVKAQTSRALSALRVLMSPSPPGTEGARS